MSLFAKATSRYHGYHPEFRFSLAMKERQLQQDDKARAANLALKGAGGQHNYRCRQVGQVGTKANWRKELPAPSSVVTIHKKLFTDSDSMRSPC